MTGPGSDTLPSSRWSLVARRLGRWWGPVSCLLVVALATGLGCVQRGGSSGTTSGRPDGAVISERLPSGTGQDSPGIGGALAHEPELGVFLRAGSRLSFTTFAEGSLDGRQVAAGVHVVAAGEGELVLDGEHIGPEAVIEFAQPANGTRFRTEVVPPTGSPQVLNLAGEPRLHLAGNEVELIERVPLETYLAGVLTAEMSPAWPQAALEAQAVAARSYACAKYLAHQHQAWQLHWHYSVDMAYAGSHARHSAASQAALEATRGQVLMYQGVPVPALFSACSGGRTEAAANIFSQLRGANGVDMTPVMPVVEDPAAQSGAQELGMAATHGHWQAELPYYQITLGLRHFAAEHPDKRLPGGAVVSVRTNGYFSDSGRVASVLISLQHGDHVRTVTLPATDFRMAVGPGLVRSTWWDHITVHSHGMTISGRGFGHGVGLSQVSAWYLAQTGEGSPAILGRFYRGADLVQVYP